MSALPAAKLCRDAQRQAPAFLERTQRGPERFVHAVVLRLQQALRSEGVADAAAKAKHRLVRRLPQCAPARRTGERCRLARTALAMQRVELESGEALLEAEVVVHPFSLLNRNRF